MKITDIRVRRRLRQDLGDLEPLMASIDSVGLIQPIVVDAKNRLIAGHRRIEAAKRLGWEEVDTVVLETGDRLRAEADENIHRKDFTPSEAVAISRALEKRERKAAEERMKAGRPSSKLDQGRADEKLGKAVGMGRSTLRKAREVVEAAEKDPEGYTDLQRQMDSSRNVHAAYSLLRRRQVRERFRRTGDDAPLPDAVDIRVGDLCELGTDIPDGSIDAIITDPPWQESTLPVFTDLGKLAMRVLKDGAPLVAYTGNMTLVPASKRLEAEGPKFITILMHRLIGPNSRLYPQKLIIHGRPMVLFSKGPYKPRGWIETIIDVPNDAEKDLHDWQQGLDASTRLVERLTNPGDLVLDPFSGSGTTLVAAARLGRRAIGFEIDPETAAIARGRIAEQAKEQE